MRKSKSILLTAIFNAAVFTCIAQDRTAIDVRSQTLNNKDSLSHGHGGGANVFSNVAANHKKHNFFYRWWHGFPDANGVRHPFHFGGFGRSSRSSSGS